MTALMTPEHDTMADASSHYDRTFYERHHDVASASAAKLVPLVIGWLEAKSVVDVGCGQGAWLLAAARLGLSDLVGCDGSWVDAKAMQEHGIRFRVADLREPLGFDRRFDLALCMEVAEHLPGTRAEGLVADLCRAADAVLFSAAVPLQGGTGHINEQRPSYWAALFAQQGYDCLDLLRPRFWDDEQVGWWYRQNALVFAKGAAAARLRDPSIAACASPLDIIHPQIYESKLREAERIRSRLQAAIQRPGFRQLMSFGFRWAKGLLRRGGEP